jgi:hypothetical protein
MPAEAEEVRIATGSSSCKGDNAEQDEWKDWCPSSSLLRGRAESEMERLLDFVDSAAGEQQYGSFERELLVRVFRLGRLLIVLFLQLWQERTPVPTTSVRGKEEYRRQPPKSRLLGTFFGKVRYWRTYLLQTNGRPGGYYPVDLATGLTADGFSIGVLGRVVRLATKMSFAAAAVVMKSFVGWSPSTKSIEEATLGMGRYTAEWVERRPPPKDDGEVLIIQADSKATPTAREQELAKRRGKRKPNPYPDSPRHRGRERRRRRGKRPRRKKGDKAKNGKMATIVVMYTLRRGTDEDGLPMLRGPVNRWIYASYAPKRHALAVARREADKRGFTSESGKQVQVLTDGDEDLERYVGELFPEAVHTLDVMHATEYLWEASACVYREGSKARRGWAEELTDKLYEGKIQEIIAELESVLDKIEEANKRKRLRKVITYLSKRTHMMNYDELDEQDLELGSGIIEGAVRYVIAQRFDEGGMRWIKARAEALLQLRCIELNEDWDAYLSFVNDKITRKQRQSRRQIRVLQDAPEPLPTYGIDK